MSHTLDNHSSPIPLTFSRAVRAGEWLLLSGHIPLDEQRRPLRGDIHAQTRNVMDSVGVTLVEFGSSWKDVVKVTVWLQNMEELDDFNRIYRTYFEEFLPVRSLVQARLAYDVGVEVEVQAWQAK
ncbi:RidA family protein [Paraburkholderia sediminicola]|uniref:RidA family protein n=1 Tax=Paraburkholderia sediminicola TaxID=458836 RepID=UPI0038BCC1B7